MKKLFLATSLFSVASMFGMQQSTSPDLQARLARAQAENIELKTWYIQKKLLLPPEPSLPLEIRLSSAPLSPKDLVELTTVEHFERYNDWLKNFATLQNCPYQPTAPSKPSYLPTE
jgi:hypothetical protein